MADFPLVGFPSSFRVPAQVGEIAFAQGASAAASSAWDVCFVMPKTSSGTWPVNTRIRVKNEIEARVGAGAGSFAHRAVRKWLLANKNSALYVVVHAASNGGSPVAATGVITYATAPTGQGVARVRVLDRVFSVAFTIVDTVTTIATAMKNAINAAIDLPVTAANTAGVLTLTAKIVGTSSGDGTIPVIKFEAEITSGVGTTVAASGAALGLGTGVAGVEGSTTELSLFTTALAVIDSVRHYFVVTSMWTEAALDALASHLNNKSEAKRGFRSVGVAGYVGSLATCQTLAISQNYERIRIAHQYDSDHDPAELASNLAAVLQKRYTVDPAYNFDSYSEVDWQIGPTRNPANRPDIDDQNDAINDGITIIASTDTRSYIVMDCTTRSKDSTGAVDDFRATEGHRVSVGDALMDLMMARAPATFGKKKLRPDPLLKDGITIDHIKLSKYADVITPHRSRGFFKGIFDSFFKRNLIMDSEAAMESLQVQIDPENGGRLEAAHEFQAISLQHQLTIRSAETNPG